MQLQYRAVHSDRRPGVETAVRVRPPDELHDAGTHLISTDEKTGIQALERVAPTKPMIAGHPEKIEFEMGMFISYFNRTMAKPYKWTYKGLPLTA